MAEKRPHMLRRDLGEAIIKKFGMEGIVSQIGEYGIRSPDGILEDICCKLQNNSAVLLIDEYDAPLTHHIDKKDELNEIISILNDFYAAVKQNTGRFRFIFITGVTRVSHVSIFSAFNNLKDLSLTREFNSLLGFTQNDLERYFDDYIGNAGKVLNMKKEEIYKRIEEYYDGFQFSIHADETLYNPWSILNFLDSPQNGFKNYWFESGGTSSLLINYLKIKDNFDFLDYDNREMIVDDFTVESKYELSNIPYNILLYQTGYFTIRKIDDNIARLVLANEEVEESIYRLYLLANNLNPKDELRKKMVQLSSAIDTKDLPTIITIFNKILNECVSSLSKIFNDERSVRDIIYAALTYIPSLRIIKERETSKGKSYLEIFTKKTCMIIEFKRSYTGRRSAAEALKLAIEQIEKSRYGITFSSNYTLYRVAMVISTEGKIILENFCKEVL